MFPKVYLFVLLLVLSQLLFISGVYSAQDIGYLSITSEPKHALIYLDANYVGSLTPTERLLPHKPGWCTVQLSKSRHKLYQERMLVKRGQVLEIHVVFAGVNSREHSRSAIKNYVEAYLTVTSEPSGADVSLNDKSIGKRTPVRDHRIPAGSTKDRLLRITKPGYQTHEEIVEWPELRDAIRLHRNIKLYPIGYSPKVEQRVKTSSDEINRRFIMDAAVVIIFALLLIVISILATLIIVKLRRSNTEER